MTVGPTIEMHVLRSKLIPISVLILVLLTLSLFLLWVGVPVFVSSLKAGRVPAFRGILLATACVIEIILCLWAVTVIIRRMIWPDQLEISETGIKISKYGKQESYLWSELGNPTSRIGRNGNPIGISVPILQCSKTVEVPARLYNQPFQTVLVALCQAKSGHLVSLS